MRLTIILTAVLVVAFAPAAADRGSPGPQTEREITHLIEHLEASRCEFYRNGSWYDSERAVSHLNRKYNYLRKRDLVPSTEAFIERAATQSSMSGKAYLVRCPGQSVVPSAEWLQEELDDYRDSTPD